jgi:hypothetical protein
MERVIAFDSKGIEEQNFYESLLIDVALSIQNNARLVLTELQWNFIRWKMMRQKDLQSSFEIWGFKCLFSKPDQRFIMTHIETNKQQTLCIYYMC